MSKFKVTFYVSAFEMTCEVEADSEEAASETAWNELEPTFPDHVADAVDDEDLEKIGE